jgi:DNA (cytosine-5)-methyltransferase 1
MQFDFIDLFAGIGGMRLGFEAVGGRCVFTSEWDRWARKAYSAYFPEDAAAGHPFAGDIRPIAEALEHNPQAVPDHHVLLAGFPCQPFSLAGVSKKNSLNRPHGFADEKQGNLFHSIAEIIRVKRPNAFLLENVKHLQSHDERRTFKEIERILKLDLKYTIKEKIISSEPWVPQKRERIFIVGFRDIEDFDFKGFNPRNFDDVTYPKLGSILQNHNELDSKYTITPKLWEYLQAYRRKHESAGNGFGYSLFNRESVSRTLSARYHKDGSEILIEGDPRPRRLTPKECAALMGFDKFGGREWRRPEGLSDTQLYRQFGNSVVVPVIEAIARYMQPYLKRALEIDRDRAEEKAGSIGR